VVRFDRVFVPPSHRGRGVAGRLAAAAFDQARAAGWRVRPTCPYLADAWVPRHQEVQDLIVD
jgi:predicted GNAT family acetyltransferase